MIKILCCYRKGFCLVVEDLATLDENPGFLIVDSGVRTIEYIGPTFLKELERIKQSTYFARSAVIQQKPAGLQQIC